jgi:hypothetical protein
MRGQQVWKRICQGEFELRTRSIGLVATIMMVLPALALSAPASAETLPDSWTVMFYMDGDNNVESYALMDLDELEMTGSSTDVNFVVLLDTLGEPANLLYVNKGSSSTVAAWGEVNMGDPATLTRFITDSMTLYPANNYALVVWDHGGGILGICWDETSSSDKLTMAEFRSGIASAGVSFDVLVLNACVMATAEVAHQVQGYADYVIFSQENMWALGFPYDKISAKMVAAPTMNGLTASLMMAQEYRDYYISIGYNGVTISVYDTAYLGSVAEAVKNFGSAMKATMSTYYRTYRSLRMSTPDPNNQADLIRFAQLVSASTAITSSTVKGAASAVISAVDGAIIYEWHSSDVANENGLGIWFPLKSRTSWTSSVETMYRALPFGIATGWADFLDTYYNKG